MAGLIALNNLKVGLNYSSVSEMVNDNSDYVTYFVNLSLKKVSKIFNFIRLICPTSNRFL